MNFPNLHEFKTHAFDTETTGLQYLVDKVFGFSVSTPKGDYYYDIRKTPKAINWYNDQVKNFNGTIVCHNASFDYRMSSFSGFKLPINQIDDTVIRACLIDEHLREYSLDYLCKKYLGEGKYGDIYRELADIFGGLATRNVQMPNLQHAPEHVVSPYAKMDTRRTLELYDWQTNEIKRQGIERIVEFELGLMPQFIKTEMHGIRVDLDYAEQAIKKITPKIDETQTRLNHIAERVLNVNSTPQVRDLFKPIQLANGNWTTENGKPMPSTGAGKASVNAEFLRSMEGDERAELVLKVRSDIKTRDTFLGKHVLEHALGGRVYPTINQSKGEDGGTGTGRLSYSGPALQQIPSRRKEIAAIVKPCFLPDEGQVWVDCDMASFEVRVFADLVNNLEIINAYAQNPTMDLHQFVADITGLVRNATYSGQPNAKQLNLSMIFNSGNGAIAEKMGMEYTHESFVPRGKTEADRVHYKKAGIEAMNVINEYHDRLKGIKELAEDCTETALDVGYVETYHGRRLRFPRGFKAYKASGLKIQATAADFNKDNWAKIGDILDGTEGHLLLNTHDSYGLSLPEDWRPLYGEIKKSIEEKNRCRVPLVLDWSGAGRNWWDALQGKDNTKLTWEDRNKHKIDWFKKQFTTG